jgi:hypothetical protein
MARYVRYRQGSVPRMRYPIVSREAHRAASRRGFDPGRPASIVTPTDTSNRSCGASSTRRAWRGRPGGRQRTRAARRWRTRAAGTDHDGHTDQSRGPCVGANAGYYRAALSVEQVPVRAASVHSGSSSTDNTSTNRHSLPAPRPHRHRPAQDSPAPPESRVPHRPDELFGFGRGRLWTPVTVGHEPLADRRRWQIGWLRRWSRPSSRSRWSQCSGCPCG